MENFPLMTLLDKKGYAMKPTSTKRKKQDECGRKIYTYEVTCSFHLQYSFSESEVEPDPGGDERDFNPTDKAILILEKDLNKTLGQNYAISELKAYAESDELLGISEQ